MDDLLYTIVQIMREFKSKPKQLSCYQKGFNQREEALLSIDDNENNGTNELFFTTCELTPYQTVERPWTMGK